jgi:hypothetical protein
MQESQRRNMLVSGYVCCSPPRVREVADFACVRPVKLGYTSRASNRSRRFPQESTTSALARVEKIPMRRISNDPVDPEIAPRASHNLSRLRTGTAAGPDGYGIM